MKRIILTDTGGEALPRFAKSCVRRVLRVPVQATSEHRSAYALVWCEQAQVGITRNGGGPNGYAVSTAEDVVHFGQAGRDAINYFFEQVKLIVLEQRGAEAA